MKRRTSLLFIVSFAFICLVGIGCDENPSSCTLIIECDDTIARTSAAVDIIGVTVQEKPAWDAYLISKYWDGDDARRRSADRITREFGLGKPNRYVLSLSDPDVKAKWDSWMSRGVSDLVIIARLKSITADAPGSADPRRTTLPLKKKKIAETWPGSKAKAFRILVQEAGIRIDPLDKVPTAPTPSK